MKKNEFERYLQQLPGLTAAGFMRTQNPTYTRKRQHFMQSAVYLQQAIDAKKVLSKFQKSLLISPWQKQHCRPSKISALIEWYSGREVSVGAITIAAFALGFELNREPEAHEPVLNLLPRQLESELRQLRVRQMIERLVS